MDRLNTKLWFCILVFSIFPLLCSFVQMEFMKRSTGLIYVCLLLPLYVFCIVFPLIVVGYYYVFTDSDTEPPRLFRGYKRTAKNIREPTQLFHGYNRAGNISRALLLFFGNIGIYYLSEKSVACILTFLFLAFYFLCILCCIRPYTDFGILEFLLSASLNVALRLFRFHFNSCLVVVACIIIVCIRYWLDPESEERQRPVRTEGSLDPAREESQLPVIESQLPVIVDVEASLGPESEERQLPATNATEEKLKYQ